MFPLICTICRPLNIPGLEDFSGASFHTSEWKKDFVATGKRIAVIGTGASAVQVVPALAEQQPSNLTVFQRWEALNALFFNTPRPAAPSLPLCLEPKWKKVNELIRGSLRRKHYWTAVLVGSLPFFISALNRGRGVATCDVQQEELYKESNFLRSAVWTLPRGDYVYSSVATTIFSNFPLACRIYRWVIIALY